MSSPADDRVERARRQVRAAFEGVEAPPYDMLGHCSRCDHESDVQALSTIDRWQHLRPEALLNMSTAFFSPAGFRFVLPALMLHALDQPDSPGLEVCNTVWGLGPAHLWKSNDEAPSGPASPTHEASGDDVVAWRSRIDALSGEQRSAVMSFLDGLRELADDDDLQEDAAKALDWWRAHGVQHEGDR